MVFSGQMGRCRVFLGLLGLLLGSGCTTVGPDYVPPQPDMPGEFKTDLQEKRFNAEAESEKTADEAKPDIPVKVVTQEMLATWWETLEDPLLIRLVDKAIGNNLELKVAQSRVREERAQRGIAESARLPNVNAVGGVSRRQNASAANAGGAVGSTLYSSGFDASWEIDLFGGIQRSVEAAGATVEATQEQLNDTLVTLVAEVALNYIEIRTFQARLQAAEKNQKTQEETLRIVEDRLEGGLSTTLSLEQAKYNLESTRSEIPTLKIGIEKAKNGLTVLLGEFPGSLDKDLDEYSRVPVTPMEVAVGVPADLLRRRPDVRQSERELAAQTARVGVATADLYPKLRLLGSVGLETLSAASFFGGPAAAYQIGPQVTWNIFSSGRIRQNIKVEDERQEQALLRYESTVLTAVKDVENALIDYAEEQVRRDSLIKSVASASEAVSYAQELYKAGLSNFLGVLEAQRSQFTLQDKLAFSEGRVMSNLIRLFKALGGGWRPLMAGAETETPVATN